MATYTVEVSTWGELVSMIGRACVIDSEYSWSNYDGVIIKLTADIDMNDELPTGYSNVFNYTRNGDGTYVMIDGEYTDTVTGEKKNHVIKNLRTPTQGTGTILAFTHDTSYVYNFYRAVYIRNLDFQNAMLLSGHLFDWDSSKLTNIHFQFDNCRFVGQRGNYYWCNKQHAIVINSCYFDLPWNGVGQSTYTYTSLVPKNDSSITDVSANYCRFMERYGKWTYDEDATNYAPDGENFYSCGYMKMSGCRIEGEMKLPRGYYVDDSNNNQYGLYNKIISSYIANGFTPTAQNVFDVKLSLATNNYESGDSVICSGWSGVIRAEAYKYDGTEFTPYIAPLDGTSIFGGSIEPIFATPTQIVNAEWLLNAGFDIIVPTT